MQEEGILYIYLHKGLVWYSDWFCYLGFFVLIFKGIHPSHFKQCGFILNVVVFDMNSAKANYEGLTIKSS